MLIAQTVFGENSLHLLEYTARADLLTAGRQFTHTAAAAQGSCNKVLRIFLHMMGSTAHCTVRFQRIPKQSSGTHFST